MQALQVQRYKNSLKNAKYRMQTSQSVAEANCACWYVSRALVRRGRRGTTPPRRRAAQQPRGPEGGVGGFRSQWGSKLRISFEVPESVVLLSVPAGWVETDNDARTNGGLNSLI